MSPSDEELNEHYNAGVMHCVEELRSYCEYWAGRDGADHRFIIMKVSEIADNLEKWAKEK